MMIHNFVNIIKFSIDASNYLYMFLTLCVVIVFLGIILCVFNLKGHSDSWNMEGSKMMEGESMKVFRDGINVVINFWWEIRKSTKLDSRSLCDSLFFWFTQSKGLKSNKSLNSFFIFYFIIILFIVSKNRHAS
jgi:hypothetical protein